MAERTFSRWIIDLMYTVFPPKKDKDLDPIWEMGCKLYIQMTKMCLNSDTSSHFYIHQLLVWPIIKYLKQRSSKDRVSNDIKRRERMVRTVICSFLDTISSNKEREKWNPSFGRDNPFMKFWRNITQILFHIEELILSFEYIRLAFSDDSSTPLKTSKRKKMISEEFSSSILERKTDQSIFENTKNYLFLSSVSNTWQDSRLLNMIFEIIEPIWTIKSKRRTSKAHKSSHTMYFKKMGYNQIEDQVLDCLDEISCGDANEKIQMFLARKVYPEESKKKERHNFTFIKTAINLICIRITLETEKKFLFYYCKMLGDIAEC